MRINEVINEDLSRRGFLRGLGAAAVTGTGATAAKAGQYKSADELNKDPNQIQKIWKPRMAELQVRCQNILDSFIQTSSVDKPDFAKTIENIKIKLTLGDNTFHQGNVARADYGPRPGTQGVPKGVPYGQIILETTVFWDAPNDTLAFILGHECGHIIMLHKLYGSNNPRNNEQEADMIGAFLAQKIGYNRANVFKFLFNVKAEQIKNNSPNDPHLEPADRVKFLKQNAEFELSKNSIQYIDSLTQKFQQGLAEEQIDEDSFDETISDIKRLSGK